MSRRVIQAWLVVLLLLPVLLSLVGASASPVAISSESLAAYAQSDFEIELPSTGTYELIATRDSFTDKKHKDTNYGTLSQFAVVKRKKRVTLDGNDLEVEQARALIGFDASPICDGGGVVSATLQIFGPASNETNGTRIREIEDSWNEYGVTYNNVPGDNQIDPNISQTTSGGIDTVTFDVRDSVVDDFGNFDAAANAVIHGWVIRDAKKSVWYSRSASDVHLRPKLTIEIDSCP